MKIHLTINGKKYEGVEGTEPTKLGGVGLPYTIAFWAEPGQESMLLKVASAYETATHHFKAPPGFGKVKGNGFPPKNVGSGAQPWTKMMMSLTEVWPVDFRVMTK